MNEQTSKLIIGQLLGSRIVTAEGKVIGHIADLQLSDDPPYDIIAIYFGKGGWLHRWHVLYPFAQLFGWRSVAHRIHWEAVASIKHSQIVLRAGWSYDAEMAAEKSATY
ncbi:MAG TPA: PRC-barrel domain-containing protein [Ktedonobacteraceae bacterium]